MSMPISQSLRLWSLLLFACLSSAADAGYAISQRYIHYYSEQRSTVVNITNTGDSQKEFSMRTPAWDDRTKVLGAELIAYPPVFSLNPGEKQTVRLLLRDKNTFTPPLFFRLVVRESEPTESVASAAKSKGLKIPISTSFPVYYIDPAAKATADTKILKDANNDIVGLWIYNNGSTLLEMRKVLTGDNTEHPVDVRVLPGRAHTFELAGQSGPFKIKVARSDDIIIDQ